MILSNESITVMKVFDTNHILRFILNDYPQTALYVRKILDEDTVYVPYEVLVEVIYVMTKTYKIDRKKTVYAIREFLEIDNVITDNSIVTKKCMKYFEETSLDFVDCLLCAYRVAVGYEVCTFDKKLLKLIERETGQQ